MSSPSKRFPPGSYGLPVLGVIPFLGPYPTRDFKKWSLEDYGPICYVKLGGKTQVILNTIDTVKEGLETQTNITLGRPDTFLFKGPNGLIFQDESEKLKTQRDFGKRILHEHFYTGGKLEEIINSEGNHLLDHLSSFFGKPLDLHTSFSTASGNIVGTILVGKRYDYDFEGTTLATCFKGVFGTPEDFKKLIAIEVLPCCARIPPFSGELQRFRGKRAFSKEFIQTLITEHKDKFDENNLKDFMDYYIKEQKCSEDPAQRGFTDDQLLATINDLCGAGIPNTSVALLWMILCTLLHPDSKEKVVDEIQNILNGREPKYEDRLKMPYTCAFMDEVWRTSSILEKTVTHKTNAELKLNEFTLPKDTEIIGNIWGSHNDPETWPEPENFDPKRHLDGEGNYVDSGKVIPFGVGRRSCFGQHWGRVQVFILFMKVLQKFDVSAEGKLPSLYDGLQRVTYDPQPYRVNLTIRNDGEREKEALQEENV